MTYEPVIGLEVHVELKTESKIFCGCSTAFGAEPNTQICPVCLGLPGTLPVFNEKVLEYAVRAGLATHCDIALFSKFDRKNYFYADLSKAYQVSQSNIPIAKNGYVEIDLASGVKKIGITQIHMEEDAGKLVHKGDSITSATASLADYNRGGVPLIEIVSEPDMRSGEEARLYLEALRRIIIYTGVSDARMEEGSLRCDVNISLRPKGQEAFGVRAEIKNLNSFKAVERAVAYEIKRQTRLLNAGEKVKMETRTWDDAQGKTFSLRSKEVADEYRYFPDPDLPPIRITQDYVDAIAAKLPEMPHDREQRMVEEDGLPLVDAQILTDSLEMADFHEATKAAGAPADVTANWLLGDVSARLNTDQKTLAQSQLTPDHLAQLISLIQEGTISGKIAKEVFQETFVSGKAPKDIIEDKGLKQISSSDDLLPIVEEAVNSNPKSVADYHAGKKKALGYFVGQVMKATKGQANPELVNKLIVEALDARKDQ